MNHFQELMRSTQWVKSCHACLRSWTQSFASLRKIWWGSVCLWFLCWRGWESWASLAWHSLRSQREMTMSKNKMADSWGMAHRLTSPNSRLHTNTCSHMPAHTHTPLTQNERSSVWTFFRFCLFIYKNLMFLHTILFSTFNQLCAC